MINAEEENVCWTILWPKFYEEWVNLRNTYKTKEHALNSMQICRDF